MSSLERYLLIIDTIFVAIGVLIYLSNLKNKSKESKAYAQQDKPITNSESMANVPVIQFSQKEGISEGEAKIIGVEEEVIPVILAAVSAYSKIPLSSLKVKSIKRLSE